MAPKNVHGLTLDQLGEAIVGGRFAPGASIPPEPQLCESFSVSRTVIREAVKSLVAKGLLVTGPKVGTRVLPSDQWNWFDPDVVAWQSKAGLTRDFLRDLQELRRVVEPAAVRMAAERASSQDIAEIEASYAGMKQAIEEGGDYVRHDLAFHQGLIGACHNRMLVQMSKALGALLRTSFEISTWVPRRPAAASAPARCRPGDRSDPARRQPSALIDSRDDIYGHGLTPQLPSLALGTAAGARHERPGPLLGSRRCAQPAVSVAVRHPTPCRSAAMPETFDNPIA
jgi:DNA-binding FadR family transcriptional regulator